MAAPPPVPPGPLAQPGGGHHHALGSAAAAAAAAAATRSNGAAYTGPSIRERELSMVDPWFVSVQYCLASIMSIASLACVSVLLLLVLMRLWTWDEATRDALLQSSGFNTMLSCAGLCMPGLLMYSCLCTWSVRPATRMSSKDGSPQQPDDGAALLHSLAQVALRMPRHSGY